MTRSSRSRAPLLVRHRWLNQIARGYFECSRFAVPIYESHDLACPGCSARIDWLDIGYPEKFRLAAEQETAWRIVVERIALALDLKAAALVIEARDRLWNHALSGEEGRRVSSR